MNTELIVKHCRWQASQMAEIPSPDGAIDWSAHPYATETERPDGCTVSQPVVVSLRLHQAPGGPSWALVARLASPAHPSSIRVAKEPRYLLTIEYCPPGG